MGGGILLILSILSLHCNAQPLDVRGFQLAPTDFTASSGSAGARQSVDDGKLAALIKIRVNIDGFQFDGGEFGLPADPDYTHPGEVWVYVRPGARKLTIRHQRFGTMSYRFNTPIESARTYIMYLDPGVGAYYNIVTDGPCGTVYLDGDSIGYAPIYNEYIEYGNHRLSALTDQWEGVLDVELQKVAGTDSKEVSSEPRSETLTIKMVDQSEFFGEVTVTTDADAQIFMDGEPKAFGSWSTELREGKYTVEARKVDCDDSRATFTVAAKQQNRVQIPSPEIHKGFIKVYTRPLNVQVTANGKAVDMDAPIELPVGLNVMQYSRKGYDTQTQEVLITHNQTLQDTVTLQRTQYLKSNGFYAGAAYTLGEFSGITGLIGMIYRNVDAELSYTFGINKKGPVNYYDPKDYGFISQSKYSQNKLQVKLGYQVGVGINMAVTPQLGVAFKNLKGSSLEGTEIPGDGASCVCASIGGKFVLMPMKQLSVFAAPQYDLSVKEDAIYKSLSQEGKFNAGGFYCNVGVSFIF